MRQTCRSLTITEKPLNTYGSLESTIRHLRDARPLDLHVPHWRRIHPQGSAKQWQKDAKRLLIDRLAYDPGPCDLQAECRSREQRPGFMLERISFNTAPWFRVEGYFLLPEGATSPVPALVVMHAWGGPMIFGKDRIVDSGRDHPLLKSHRDSTYSGRYLAEEFAKNGYAVLVIDAHHFGPRSPRGIADIPLEYDPFSLSVADAERMNEQCVSQLYPGLKQLMWAGTTWMGLNLGDDMRCVDYLCSRPEVDATRIGCTGLSGGGWRTNVLAAMDPRMRASVSVGWMSTGDHQQVYNLRGSIGTFCLVPGLWSRLDLPDLPVIGAPCASLVVIGEQDDLVPQAGAQQAAELIKEGYAWAGCPDRFHFHHPDKRHVYDAEIQLEALGWFDRWLKATQG